MRNTIRVNSKPTDGFDLRSPHWTEPGSVYSKEQRAIKLRRLATDLGPFVEAIERLTVPTDGPLEGYARAAHSSLQDLIAMLWKEVGKRK